MLNDAGVKGKGFIIDESEKTILDKMKTPLMIETGRNDWNKPLGVALYQLRLLPRTLFGVAIPNSDIILDAISVTEKGIYIFLSSSQSGIVCADKLSDSWLSFSSTGISHSPNYLSMLNHAVELVCSIIDGSEVYVTEKSFRRCLLYGPSAVLKPDNVIISKKTCLIAYMANIVNTLEKDYNDLPVLFHSEHDLDMIYSLLERKTASMQLMLENTETDFSKTYARKKELDILAD